ncbi:UxaA family hydrolase [Morganella morganii]
MQLNQPVPRKKAGNPIVPVVRISANSAIAQRLSDMIDYDYDYDYDCGPVTVAGNQ